MANIDSQILSDRARAEAAREAVEAVAGISLPTINNGDALKILEVNLDEDGYQLSTVNSDYLNTKFGSLIASKEYVDNTDVSLQNQINNIANSQSSGLIGYESKAIMDADILQPVGTVALVGNDSLSSNNGYYRWDGSIWVKRNDFYDNILDPDNTSEAVTGRAVSNYVEGWFKDEGLPYNAGETNVYKNVLKTVIFNTNSELFDLDLVITLIRRNSSGTTGYINIEDSSGNKLMTHSSFGYTWALSGNTNKVLNVTIPNDSEVVELRGKQVVFIVDETQLGTTYSNDYGLKISKNAFRSEFAGIANPSTTPINDNEKRLVYLANQDGTYTNFGNIEINNELVLLVGFAGSWEKEVLSNKLVSKKWLQNTNDDFDEASFSTIDAIIDVSIKTDDRVINDVVLTMVSLNNARDSIYIKMESKDGTELFTSNYTYTQSIDSNSKNVLVQGTAPSNNSLGKYKSLEFEIRVDATKLISNNTEDLSTSLILSSDAYDYTLFLENLSIDSDYITHTLFQKEIKSASETIGSNIPVYMNREREIERYYTKKQGGVFFRLQGGAALPIDDWKNQIRLFAKYDFGVSWLISYPYTVLDDYSDLYKMAQYLGQNVGVWTSGVSNSVTPIKPERESIYQNIDNTLDPENKGIEQFYTNNNIRYLIHEVFYPNPQNLSSSQQMLVDFTTYSGEDYITISTDLSQLGNILPGLAIYIDSSKSYASDFPVALHDKWIMLKYDEDNNRFIITKNWFFSMLDFYGSNLTGGGSYSGLNQIQVIKWNAYGSKKQAIYYEALENIYLFEEKGLNRPYSLAEQEGGGYAYETFLYDEVFLKLGYTDATNNPTIDYEERKSRYQVPANSGLIITAVSNTVEEAKQHILDEYSCNRFAFERNLFLTKFTIEEWDEIFEFCKLNNIPVYSTKDLSHYFFDNEQDKSQNIFPRIDKDVFDRGKPDGFNDFPLSGVSINKTDGKIISNNHSIEFTEANKSASINNLSQFNVGINKLRLYAKCDSGNNNLVASIGSQTINFSVDSTSYELFEKEIEIENVKNNVSLQITQLNGSKVNVSGIEIFGV